MGTKKVVEFPSRYEAEIELAERSYDLILERMAHGRLSEATAGGGDVASMVDAVGELLVLDARETGGRRISQKRMDGAVSGLESAVGRLSSWPDLPRLLVIAPLVEALEELELEWVAGALMASLPDLGTLDESGFDEALPALGRITAVHLRIMMESRSWDPGFEASLRALREAARRAPDDEDLQQTLNQGVIFHAVRSRQALLERERRKMAGSEPLPDELTAALDDYQNEIADIGLARWSLHLVVADVLAAGLAPDWAIPRQIVAAAELAIVREDDPELALDLLRFARWARLKPKKLAALRDTVAAALDWAPDGYEGSVEVRQERRWRIDSGSMDFWPVRWTPDDDAPDRPPYSEEAARARIEELRDVAWMMIDGIEAVRFVAGAFRYGGDAPEEMESDVTFEAIHVWKEERLVHFDSVEDGDHAEALEDDLEEDPDDRLPR